MALIVIAQPHTDVGNGQVGIEKIMGGQFHAIVEEILKDGGPKLMLEGLLQGALVGTHHHGKLMQRGHVLIAREQDVFGIMHLVAHKKTKVSTARRETSRRKESREAVNDLRLHVAMGVIAHQTGLIKIVGRPDYRFLYRSVGVEKEVGIVLA